MFHGARRVPHPHLDLSEGELGFGVGEFFGGAGDGLTLPGDVELLSKLLLATHDLEPGASAGGEQHHEQREGQQVRPRQGRRRMSGS